MANCPGQRSEQTGLLLGVVRDVDSGAPLPRARVVSRWFELTLGPGGPRYETLEAAAITDQTGVYRLCGRPGRYPRVRASAHGDPRIGPRRGLLLRVGGCIS